MTPVRWFLLATVLILGSLTALFVVQNLEQTTVLYLDLWLYAGKLQQPVPVPWLVLGCFGAGLILGGGWGLLGRMGMARRVEELEQEVARASLRGSGTSGSASSSGTFDDGWA